MASFIFGIDVSGNPYQTTYVSLASFNVNNYGRIMKDLRHNFPNTRKGSDLNDQRLKNIIKFLDKNGIKMVSICFSNADWNYYKEKYGQHGNFKENIFGVIYFVLLQEVSNQKYRYRVTVDKENFMNIEKVIETCRKLAKSNDYFFDLSIGHSRTDELIKIADYIASSHRKINHEDLKFFRNLKIISSELPGKYLTKVFR